MKQYIPKSALVSEIERRLEERQDIRDKARWNDDYWPESNFCIRDNEDEELLTIINTLEVETGKETPLEKFKSLQHISRDLHQTLEDWGYAPNLYFFDGMWHISWISCEEGDSIKDFEGNTPEEAIDKAYNWFHSTFCNS